MKSFSQFMEGYDLSKQRQMMQRQHQLDKQRLALQKMDAKLDDMEAKDAEEDEDDDETLSPTEKLMRGPVKTKTNSITDRIMKGKSKKEVA